MINPDEIEKVAVYPPLGIARVGNAPGEDDWFYASEVVGRAPDIPTSEAGLGRDESGRVLRQVARFRVYAHMNDGSVAELGNDAGAAIEWRVTLANLKAGWYRFLNAMDLPANFVKVAARRNADVDPDREPLDITPRSRSISGANTQGPEFRFDDGEFFEKSVYLGELRTDQQGRLIVLGGMGLSEPQIPGTEPTTFANNDGWHDDVSDGPVQATVTIGETRFSAEPGYVVVAPPNYAPGLFGVVTMEDAVRETWMESGWLERPTASSFTDDIWPIFDRISQMAWVNHGIYVAVGHGSPLDSRAPEVIDRLRDRGEEAKDWRSRVFALFLPPSATAFDPGRLPQLFGDGIGETGETSALERLSLTPTMYAHLERWRDGEFDDDWPGAIPEPPEFEDLSTAEQVNHLERVALHECLGGPFHPGIEITWPLRDPRQWERPYRLAVLDGEQPARQNFGPELTREVCLADGGPLDGVAAGSMTRWLGVPWQTDEASCNSDADYAPSLYLSMPSFWGARVPEQVLSSEAWSRIADGGARTAQRRKHFSFREDWLRDIRGRNYIQRITNMVTRWWQLGMVTPLTVEEASIGEVSGAKAWVETGRPESVAGSNEKLKLVAKIEGLDQPLEEGAGFAPVPPYRPPRVRFKRGEV